MTQKAGFSRGTVRWTTVQIAELQRQMLIADGKDPSIVPDEAFRFLTLKEVKSRLGLSTATIYRAMAMPDARFPRPVKIGSFSAPPQAA